jgi:hypothetical protein
MNVLNIYIDWVCHPQELYCTNIKENGQKLYQYNVTPKDGNSLFYFIDTTSMIVSLP